MFEQRYVQEPGSSHWRYEYRLTVADLSDPRAPTVSTLGLPPLDDSYYGGLVPDGENVLFSHYEAVSGQQRARFYIDRVDLSSPKQPKLADKINVPGALLHYDRARGRAITAELVSHELRGITMDECYKRFAYASWGTGNPEGGASVSVCSSSTQRLQLVRFVPGGAVLDDTHELADDDRISASSMGDGRVVAVLGRGYGFYPGLVAIDCFGPCGGYGGSSGPSEVLVLGGLASGSFEVGRLTVDDVAAGGWWGFYGAPPVYASGTKALVQSQDDVAILDVSNVAAPKLLRAEPLFGYPRGFSASGATALFALGTNGVQRIEL
jgi:hypothetical protein